MPGNKRPQRLLSLCLFRRFCSSLLLNMSFSWQDRGAWLLAFRVFYGFKTFSVSLSCQKIFGYNVLFCSAFRAFFCPSFPLHQFTSPAPNVELANSFSFSPPAPTRSCYSGRLRQQTAILLDFLFLFAVQRLKAHRRSVAKTVCRR